jgi:membrane protease YdiL (CAAX protease family)
VLMLSVLGLGMMLLGVAGLVLGIVFVVRARRGAWRPVGGAFRAPAYLLWEAFILFMFLYAAQALPRALLPAPVRLAAAGRLGAERGTVILLLWAILTDLLAFLALLYLAVALRRRGLTLAEIGLTAREAGTQVLWGVGAYVASTPWVFLIGWLAQWAGERFFPNVAPPYHPILSYTASAPAGWARFGLFLLVAVSAPIVEETFFRGILYGALRRRFGVAAGVIFSAAIFASLHPQVPLGFLPIFVIGALLAGLYEWRRSLLPGMVFHAVNNGLIFLLLTLFFPPAA